MQTSIRAIFQIKQIYLLDYFLMATTLPNFLEEIKQMVIITLYLKTTRKKTDVIYSRKTLWKNHWGGRKATRISCFP